jgi:ubiquitin C-terminal hydrolase
VPQASVIKKSSVASNINESPVASNIIDVPPSNIIDVPQASVFVKSPPVASNIIESPVSSNIIDVPQASVFEKSPVASNIIESPVSSNIIDVAPLEGSEELSSSKLVPILNVGNQCYMIAIFQLLLRIDTLWNWLQKEVETGTFNTEVFDKKIILQSGTLMMGGLIHEEHNRCAQNNISPSPIKFETFDNARRKSLPSFKPLEQEDASEFLASLIECFSTMSEDKRCIDLERQMFIHFQHWKECDRCKAIRKSETDYVSMYALPFDRNKMKYMKKVSDLIKDEFETRHLMDEDNFPNCENCGNIPTPTREWGILTHTPTYLLFNLRRYESVDGKTKKAEIKIEADRKISVQFLNEDEKLSREIYFLHGVVCHVGKEYGTGHYTTYLLETMNKQTYYHFLNDRSHEAIDEKEFEKKTTTSGYIYLYSKKEPPSFENDPYSHISTRMNNLANVFRKDLVHSFRAKNPNRIAKKARKSDVHVGKDQVFMTKFVKKKNNQLSKDQNKERIVIGDSNIQSKSDESSELVLVINDESGL